MDETKLRQVAQTEYNNHRKEYERVRTVVDRLMDAMEYHSHQMDLWNSYLGSLVISQQEPRLHLVTDNPPELVAPDIIA